MFEIGKQDEQSLAKRLRNGENGAMREFYSRYADMLAGVCQRYITDEEDLKDVFQNALLHIISHIRGFQYRGAGSLQAWAKKVTVNEALKFLQRARQSELVQTQEELPDVAEEDDPPVRDIPPDVLMQMLSQLPMGYRTVFNLYVIEGFSHQEISRLLGIKEASSSSQLIRAKALLAKMIQQYITQRQHQ